jgi:transcriptional regulator with XRE-family HTH domain
VSSVIAVLLLGRGVVAVTDGRRSAKRPKVGPLGGTADVTSGNILGPLIPCGEVRAQIRIVPAQRAYGAPEPTEKEHHDMTETVSTGRRRELGAELRRIREQRGYKGYDMASRLGWTTSTVSRVETGKRSLTQVEVATYTALCGVVGEELDELLELAKEPDSYRIKPHGGRLSDELRTLIFHESTATDIETVEPIYIPGLAQTPDYARALFEEGGATDKAQIEEWVRIRMERRSLLSGWSPPQCVFYVHENALRAQIGSPSVMNEQLLHLLFLGSRPHCSVRVVPISAGARGLPAGSFHIFRYAEDRPVACVQHEATSEFLEDRIEMATYRRILNRVASVALDEGQSREFLALAASDHERLGETWDGSDARGPGGLAQEQL